MTLVCSVSIKFFILFELYENAKQVYDTITGYCRWRSDTGKCNVPFHFRAHTRYMTFP